MRVWIVIPAAAAVGLLVGCVGSPIEPVADEPSAALETVSLQSIEDVYVFDLRDPGTSLDTRVLVTEQETVRLDYWLEGALVEAGITGDLAPALFSVSLQGPGDLAAAALRERELFCDVRCVDCPPPWTTRLCYCSALDLRPPLEWKEAIPESSDDWTEPDDGVTDPPEGESGSGTAGGEGTRTGTDDSGGSTPDTNSGSNGSDSGSRSSGGDIGSGSGSSTPTDW